jgi:hypothetical protein
MWNDLVAAFRDQPGNVSNAARRAGVSRATAHKAWEKGWRFKPWGKVPIEQVLKDEAEAARAARIAAEQEEARQEAERAIQARLDAIQARAEEATMVRHGRKGATNLAVISIKLTVLVDKLVNEMERRMDAGGLQTISPSEMRKWVMTMGTTMHHAHSVMRLALEIERIVAGEPISVIGVRVDHMKPEQMVEELSSMARTLERAQGLAERKAASDLAAAQVNELGSNKVN